MKKATCTAVLFGVCAALIGCTATSQQGPETVSHRIETSAPLVQPSSEEEEMVTDGFSLSVQGRTILPAPKEIVIIINNGTDKEVGYGESYWLERQTGHGQWEKLDYLPDAAWHDIGILASPHSRSEHRIHPVDFYGVDALSPGRYRYGNTFDGEIYYAEFDIVASKDVSSMYL